MLKGWKEICSYTKYSRSTLYRWMRTKNFPILKGKGVRPPLSSRAMIDLWLADRIEKQWAEDKKNNE